MDKENGRLEGILVNDLLSEPSEEEYPDHRNSSKLSIEDDSFESSEHSVSEYLISDQSSYFRAGSAIEEIRTLENEKEKDEDFSSSFVSSEDFSSYKSPFGNCK